MDVNRYATKKTVAQGMLDVALLSVNVSQLKYILQVGEDHQFYTLLLTLLIISIVLQIIAGITFLVLAGLDISKDEHHRKANLLNNSAVIVIFMITFLNVIVSGLGVVDTANVDKTETMPE